MRLTAAAAAALHEAGWPATFLLVFDELWDVMRTLKQPLIEASSGGGGSGSGGGGGGMRGGGLQGLVDAAQGRTSAGMRHLQKPLLDQ